MTALLSEHAPGTATDSARPDPAEAVDPRRAALAERCGRYRREEHLRERLDERARHITVRAGSEYRAVTMPADLGEHVRAQLSKSGISAPVVEHRRARRWTFLTGPAAALDTAAAAQLFRLFATVAPVGSEIVLPSPDDERTGYRTWVQRPGAALPRLHDVVAATLATAPKRPAR